MIHDLCFVNGSLIVTLWAREMGKMHSIYFVLAARKMCMFLIKVEFYIAVLMISCEKWMVIKSASPAWVSDDSTSPRDGRKSTDARTSLLIYKVSKLLYFSENSSLNHESFHKLWIDGLGFFFSVWKITSLQKQWRGHSFVLLSLMTL